LQVVPHFGVEQAGRNRCRLIREAFRELLQRKRRGLLRAWQDDAPPFAMEHSLVQLLLVSPERGFLSIAPAPMPFQFRRVLSPFPKGDIPVAIDKAAPSRAFTKLVEAELHLGRRLAPGETCVDLGASPGSWSYVALQRGAKVVAVDRAPLRADLMRHRHLTFLQGDAFTFRPEAPADWLLCDVIAAPERSIELLLRWLREGWARRFVVTIKFKGHEDYARLDELKHALATQCSEFFLTRLCANKNEACAFGVAGMERDSVQRSHAIGGVGT
jgi:23S rRNA (cytidine2498-2'-O)-methyltransferase